MTTNSTVRLKVKTKKKIIEDQTKPKRREVTFCGHRPFVKNITGRT